MVYQNVFVCVCLYTFIYLQVRVRAQLHLSVIVEARRKAHCLSSGIHSLWVLFFLLEIGALTGLELTE